MPLTVLTDRDVRELIDTFTKDDAWKVMTALADALHSYSTAVGTHDSVSCSSNQPMRLSLKQKDGSTSLFMPSASDLALGVKVLTISESSTADKAADDVESLRISDREESVSSRQSSLRSSTTAATTASSSSGGSTTASSNRTGSIASIPSTLSSSTTTSSTAKDSTHSDLAENIREPLGLLEPSATSPKGCLTLLDPDGSPRALINASTLTAFRTALASCLILKQRQNVHTVTVFGAGLQAYWHVYLTLLLKHENLHHIHIVNRDFKRAQRLLMTLAQSENVAVADAFLSSKMRPSILTPEFVEYSRLLKENVRNADVIYCCTPSTKPLFPAGHLTHSEGRRKARYIACIGSYKPHMQELHEDVLKQAVRGPEEHHSHLHIGHKHVNEGGAIIVDSIEGAMKEAGEIIKARISGQGLVELGEIVMLKRSHWAEKAEREAAERAKREKAGIPAEQHQHHGGHGLAHLFHHGGHQDSQAKQGRDHEDGLFGWLSRGNVIYKSVGLGLMDVVVGQKLVELAEERGFGTRIDDF